MRALRCLALLALSLPGVARADDVLVPGKTPLTQSLVDAFRAHHEWVLDIRLTPDQRRNWEKLFVAEFKKNDVTARAGCVAYCQVAAQRLKEADKRSAGLRAALRAGYLRVVLAALSKSPDPDDRLLLEVWKESNRADDTKTAVRKAWENAIAKYTEELKIDPKSARAYTNRGVAFVWTGDDTAAIADYTQALKLDPRWVPAYYFRGNAFSRKGEHDKAIADYTEALKLNPMAAEVYTDRGSSHLRKGEYAEAIADCTKALKVNPKSWLAYHERGVAYSNQNQELRAIADYTRAIKFNPKNAQTYLNRSLSYAAVKDARAHADREQARKLDSALVAADDARTSDRKRRDAMLQALAEQKRHETRMFIISTISPGGYAPTPGYGYGYDVNPRTYKPEFKFGWR